MMNFIYKTTILSLVYAMASFTMMAADFDAEQLSFNIINEYQVEVAKAESNLNIEGELSLPKSVSDGRDTYDVVGVGNNAFAGCDKITSVCIPNTIAYVGNGAFAGCDNLATVEVYAHVIGQRAFAGSNIEKLFLGYIEQFEAGAFADSSIKDIYCFSLGLTDCSDDAFSVNADTQLHVRKEAYTAIRTNIFFDLNPQETTYDAEGVIALFNNSPLSEATFCSDIQRVEKTTLINRGVCEGVGYLETDDFDKNSDNLQSYREKLGWEAALLANEDDDNTMWLADALDSRPEDSEEITSTPLGVDEIANTDITVSSNGCTIVVTGNASQVEVYGINGSLIYSGSNQEIAVAPGVYVVKADNLATKLLVK